MADKHVLGPVSSVTINGTDISQFVTNVTIEDSAEEVDVTGFGEVYREFIPGLKDSSVQMTLLGGTTVDNLVGGLYYNDLAGTVKVNPNTAGTTVYTQISKVLSYPPVSGAPGDARSIDVTFRNYGTAGLTRGTV